MDKFKILPFRNGFKVWELISMGNGYGWEDVEKRIFKSKEEAQEYIKERKVKK